MFANGNNLSYGGVIRGDGSLVMNGPGTLTLTGDNTYAGSTTINDGELRLGNAVGRWPNMPWTARSGQLRTGPRSVMRAATATNGIMVGSATYVTGPNGQAIQFPGGDNYVSVSNPTNDPFLSLNTWTISAWIQIPAGNPSGPILTGSIANDPSDFEVFYTGSSFHADIPAAAGGWLTITADLPVSLIPGTWHMITYTVHAATESTPADTRSTWTTAPCIRPPAR